MLNIKLILRIQYTNPDIPEEYILCYNTLLDLFQNASVLYLFLIRHKIIHIILNTKIYKQWHIHKQLGSCNLKITSFNQTSSQTLASEEPYLLQEASAWFWDCTMQTPIAPGQCCTSLLKVIRFLNQHLKSSQKTSNKCFMCITTE